MVELYEHVEEGYRIALTTDCWTARGNKEYMAVTAHKTDKKFNTVSMVLDLVLLEEPHYLAKYLYEKL
jgi:hypothetical protein